MIIVLGNKADLEQEINYDQERLLQLKKQFDIEHHYLVSAKTGKNVSKSFSEITSLLIEKEEQE